MPTIEEEGWTLLSGEERQRDDPESFTLPTREARVAVCVGDAVKLLFNIETREDGRVIDRGVDRMWVIVRSRIDDRFCGVLDSDPGLADGLKLRPGQEIAFGPEHIVEIDTPPREYIVDTYGASFFDDGDAG